MFEFKKSIEDAEIGDFFIDKEGRKWLKFRENDAALVYEPDASIFDEPVCPLSIRAKYKTKH